MYEQDKQTGVSPVIGVILMVAVTVALVALVTVVVFDIGGEISESPDASVELQSDLGDQDLTATVLRNENVERFKLKYEATDGSSFTTRSEVQEDSPSAGTSFSVSDDSSLDPGSGDTILEVTGSAGTSPDNSYILKETGTVIVVAELADGSQEVLTTTDYDFS